MEKNLAFYHQVDSEEGIWCTAFEYTDTADFITQLYNTIKPNRKDWLWEWCDDPKNFLPESSF